jgi:hypothetical protein
MTNTNGVSAKNGLCGLCSEFFLGERGLLVVTHVTTAHDHAKEQPCILPLQATSTSKKSDIHQPTTHTYRNAVILVHVVKACIPTGTKPILQVTVSEIPLNILVEHFVSCWAIASRESDQAEKCLDERKADPSNGKQVQ